MAARDESGTTTPFPGDYAGWRHCIEVECGIPLSAGYVAQRIAVLSDPACEETKRFTRLYGVDWHRQVLAWFQRAAGEG